MQPYTPHPSAPDKGWGAPWSSIKADYPLGRQRFHITSKVLVQMQMYQFYMGQETTQSSNGKSARTAPLLESTQGRPAPRTLRDDQTICRHLVCSGACFSVGLVCSQ